MECYSYYFQGIGTGPYICLDIQVLPLVELQEKRTTLNLFLNQLY